MRTFPSNFVFGIGDADLQVIGEKFTVEEEGSAPTMWTHCAESSGRVFGNHTPREGVDRFHRWEEDVQIIADLGVRTYRTSVSMARLLTPQGTLNKKALAWYRRYFEALRVAGIEVNVTLYHWELPLFLHERGGWTSRESVAFLEKHARTVALELDDLISEYLVINEHICIAFLGYFEGLHAPFEKDLGKALQAAHHLLVAQGKALKAVKEIRPHAKVGTVYNLCPVYGQTAKERDLLAQKRCNGMFFDWLLEPVFTGAYPEHMVEALREYYPKVEDGDFEEIKVGKELSTLGINYYFGQTVTHDPSAPSASRWAQSQYQVTTGLGWPVYAPPNYPRGLYDLLVRTYARYELLGLRRIVITENGTAWPAVRAADGTIDDEFRIKYIEEHLGQVWDAIRMGVPVEGYFLWTLMDNYEWQEGYRPESAFGIVNVDRDTMTRTKKRSFDWYKGVIERNGL